MYTKFPKARLKARTKLMKLRHRLRTPLRSTTEVASIAVDRIPMLSRRAMSAVFMLLVVLGVVLSLLLDSAQPAVAVTLNLNNNDLVEGNASFSNISRANNALSLQDGVVGSWNAPQQLPQLIPSLTYGTQDLAYGPNDTIYMMSAIASTCHFAKYDTEQGTWDTSLHVPPVGCNTGNTLNWDGGNSMYFVPGGNTTRFFRYDIPDDSWHELSALPLGTSSNTAAQWVTSGGNKFLYLLRGGSSLFYRYNVASNVWEVESQFTASQTPQWGVAMTWDGSNTIYALDAHIGDFRKYSITTNTWSTIASGLNNNCTNGPLQYASGKIFSVRQQFCSDITNMAVYDVGTNTWTTLPAPPAPATQYDFPPPSTYDGSRYLYTLLGPEVRPQIYRFDTIARTWDTPSLFASGTDNGAYHWKVMYDGTNGAYWFGGAGSGSFDRVYKYDMTTNTSTAVGGQLSTTRNGWVGTYSGGSFYVLPYAGNNTFGKYDTSTNTLTALATLPFNTNVGSDIVDGGNGYLYATAGSATGFYRYDIAGNSWSTLAASPISPGAGAGVSRIGTKIYVLAGGQTGQMMQYDMTGGTWSYVQGMPSGFIDYGGFLTGDNARYLYAGVSDRTNTSVKKVYRYDTTTGAWQRIADLPQGAEPYASAFYDTTANKLWVAQGLDSSQMWSWSPGTTTYVTSGTWYSKTYDLTQTETWGALNATVTGTGTTTFSTRTSPNGKIWSNWQAASGTTINSPVNRYLQIKVNLTGNGASTPTVSNISVVRSQETNAPSLPSQFNAFSTKGGATLTSGASYEWRHPYFNWSPSDDGSNGSGVAGYYVYFGTDSNADPATAGSFQTGTEYTTTQEMTAGDINYLRIKVKDNLGNVSGAATFFSYRYFYVSPPGQIVQTSTADFQAGDNTNVAVNGGSMGLVRSATGAWSTGSGAMLPDSVIGSSEVVIGNYMYVARGSNSTAFWRYDLTYQRWDTMAATPNTVYLGSSITYDGGNYLYLMRGNSSQGFYRYDITANNWTTLPNIPSNVVQGSEVRYIGNGKLAIMLASVREFYFYDTATNQFSAKSPYPTPISDAGSGTWWDGGDNLYAYLGGNGCCGELSRPAMVKYSIANDTWKTLAFPPVIATYIQNNLVPDGQGNLYTFTNNNSDDINRNQRVMKYNILSDSWDQVPGLNSNPTWGSVTSDGARYIYLLPSENLNTRKIVRYDTWTNQYTPTTAGPDGWERIPWDSHTNSYAWNLGNASTSVYDGSKYIYSISANEGNSARMMKFDPATGKTVNLPAPSTGVGVSDSITYMNGSVYLMPARSTKEFWRFDDPARQWVRMADLPGTVYRPGQTALQTIGGNIYAFGGNGTALYKFTPNGGTGTWAAMTSAPGAVLNGAMAFDSATGNIYVAAGNSNRFYRYNVAGNSWTTLATLPTASSYGVTLVINNGKIYAQLGNYTTTSYVYDITSASWSAGVNSPEQFRYGSTMINMGSYAIALAGENSPDYWQFNFPSATTAYNGLGVHISTPFAIAGIFDWANITAQANIPANTSVELYTRTSDDGTTWNNWSLASNLKNSSTQIQGSITSPVKRYIQVKVIMASADNVSSPTVDSYAINYYFDVDPPHNATTLDAYSDSTKATPISNLTWYNYAQPDFDWPDPGQSGGATDGLLGSRVAGYWVYVGTDPTASPRTGGVFVTASEYSPSLVQAGNYYVRIQAQDLAGNVDPSVFAPFEYKFDNVYPTNPALVSATPSGYTTHNDFSFVWPSGYDADSGLAGYCYHTGATSGPFAVDTCQTGTTLDNLSLAYQQGTNVLYVRAYDNAGNYSPSYTSVSFYYSTQPPGPVTNLRAIPPSSPQNLFTFIWDLPSIYSGDSSQLSYCYSINELPTALNTSCTDDKYLAPFKAATQQGTNVLYMVAKDEANNADWTNFASTNFIANTVAPGIPLNLVVSDTSDRNTKRWSLTETWDAPVFAGNGIASYHIERSDDGVHFTEIGSTSAKAYVDLSAEPNVTYYYRIRAADNIANEGGPSGYVSGTAKGAFSDPPAIIVAPAVTADSNQATVTWATDRASTSFVYYGTTPADLSQSKGGLDLVTAHAQKLTGLQPSTTYFYKVQSFDNDRTYSLNDSYSQIFSFTTTAAARIYNVSADDPTMDSALLSWSTSVPTSGRIEYGPTMDYAFSASDGTSMVAGHNFKLTGLQAGTTYHYRIIASTALGSDLYSDDYTFSTLARPVISSVQFQSLDDQAQAGVEVDWKTNVPTSSTAKYEAQGQNAEVTKSDLTTSHSVTIRNLASAADYTFTLEGRDQYGNLATSSPQVWRSSVDTRPPSISNVSISVTTTQGTGGQKAQMIVVWNTDEPATTQVSYGKYSTGKMDKTTPLDTEPTTNHVAIISDLDLSDIYQVQFSSKDLSGNTSYSSKTLVVTPDKEQSLLDSTLDLLLKVFRF